MAKKKSIWDQLDALDKSNAASDKTKKNTDLAMPTTEKDKKKRRVKRTISSAKKTTKNRGSYIGRTLKRALGK